MKESAHPLAASRAAYRDSLRVSPGTAARTAFGGLVLCLLFVFGNAASGQDDTTNVGVFEFQDESGAGLSSGVAQEIARRLAQKLNADSRDVLARRLDAVADASSISVMTVEQLGALGKQHGVRFVVRGGLLAASDGDSNEETSAAVQLYAEIVSVEALNVRTVRAEGRSAAKDDALSIAIGRLAELVHEAIVSPAPGPANEPSQTSGDDEPGDVDAAESDEELQQLIAQAESLVAAGAVDDTERLASLSQALGALKAALKAKATLLEEGKDAAPADQEVVQQKEVLLAALSAVAQGEMAGPADEIQEPQLSGEEKSALASISEYAGEALTIIQKIQEIRAALRGASESDQQTETSGPDPTEEAPLFTEESTEEIDGVVTEMGEPVAGVTVTEPESGVKAETDSNGAYALPGVVAGRLATLVLARSGKQIAMGQIDLVRGRSSIADFELKPQTTSASHPALRIIPSTVLVARAKPGDGNVGLLKGVVRDAQGRPVGRALVHLKGSAIARTDSRGQYLFLNVRPGAHQLIVQRSGLRPKTEMVQVEAKKSSEAQIQFRAADKMPNAKDQQSLLVRGTGTVLRGVVLGPQRHPLPGAKITVVRQTSAMSVLAGPRGNYLLRDLKPGSYRVLVSKGGHDVIVQTVIIRKGEVRPQDFQLRKTNSPFVERALAARRIKQSLSAGNAGKVDKQVDREGQPRSTIISAGEPSPVQTRIGRLRGRVTDSRTGKAVSGATVSIQGRPLAKTDEQGDYSVPEVPAGRYQISVSRAEFSEQERSVRVPAGKSVQENFVLVAENADAKRSATGKPHMPAGGAEVRKGQLRGRVVDAKTGRPVPGAVVSVAGQRPVTSGREGSYAFNDLAPGAYRVIARKSEFLDGTASLVIRSGETTTADLRLNPKPLSRVR